MLKKILTLICLFISFNLSAQENIIEGIILDLKSGEVMPFVNIALSGGKVGTISDINGEFKLSVPENMLDKEVSFSSVGYKPITFKISQISNSHFEVKMESVDLKIDEVLVVDKSEAGRKVLKNTIENFTQNMVCQPFAYAGVYKSTLKKGSDIKTSTYNFNEYDSKGYNLDLKPNAFESLNYKFQNINRNFKVNDYASGVNFFDLISSFDILRYELNVINSYNLSDFDFTIKSENSDFYVIEFNCLNLKLTNTNCKHPEKYFGEISVNKHDNSIQKIDFTLQAKNFSLLATSVEDKTINNKAVIKCSVEYAKVSDKYSLKDLKSTISVTGTETYTLEESININSVNYKVPGKISGKVFYAR